MCHAVWLGGHFKDDSILSRQSDSPLDPPLLTPMIPDTETLLVPNLSLQSFPRALLSGLASCLDSAPPSA